MNEMAETDVQVDRIKIELQRQSMAAKAAGAHRRFCMACGTPLVQAKSRRVGLCAACRKHCACCGRETGSYGHYDVCYQCKPMIDTCIQYMRKHGGNLPPRVRGDATPARRAICRSCGDPATRVLDKIPYCAECCAEWEAGREEEQDHE